MKCLLFTIDLLVRFLPNSLANLYGSFGELRADWKFLGHVESCGVGHGGNRKVGSNVGNRDLGIRKGRARRVGYGSGELAILNLREGS